MTCASTLALFLAGCCVLPSPTPSAAPMPPRLAPPEASLSVGSLVTGSLDARDPHILTQDDLPTPVDVYSLVLERGVAYTIDVRHRDWRGMQPFREEPSTPDLQLDLYAGGRADGQSWDIFLAEASRLSMGRGEVDGRVWAGAVARDVFVPTVGGPHTLFVYAFHEEGSPRPVEGPYELRLTAGRLPVCTTPRCDVLPEP